MDNAPRPRHRPRAQDRGPTGRPAGATRRRIPPRRRDRHAALVIDRQRLIIMFVTNLRGPDAPALVHARVGEVARVTTTVGNVPVVFAALCYAGTLRLTDPDPDAFRSWTNALVPDLRAEVDALCASAPTGADRRLASQAGLRVWHIVDPETCTRLPSRHFRPWRALDLDHQGRPRHLDAVVDGARVYDTARVMFLRGCLTQRQRTPAQRVR
jgi:hypothetical protein